MRTYGRCPDCKADGELEGDCEVYRSRYITRQLYQELWSCPQCHRKWWERAEFQALANPKYQQQEKT